MLKFTSDADCGNILSVAHPLSKKTRAMRLNFALPDISSSIIWKDRSILCYQVEIGKIGSIIRKVPGIMI